MAQAFDVSLAMDLIEELEGILSRYVDLINAQRSALETGLVTKAAMLGRSAESILATAYRVDRRLGALRSTTQLDKSTRRIIENRLNISTARVRTAASRLGDLLAQERSKMLDAIGNLEPNRTIKDPNREWTAQPVLLNIRT